MRTVKSDLTNFKSVNEILICEISFGLEEENMGEQMGTLIVCFHPYLYNNVTFDLEALVFHTLHFPTLLELNKKYDFAGIDFGQSFCLFNKHNPITLISIEFKEFSGTEMKIEAILLFNFETEGVVKKQILTLETLAKR